MTEPLAGAPQEGSRPSLAAFSDELAAVVERAAGALVTIAARPRQAATGIVWPQGDQTIVLTADHVVEREDDIRITLPDGRAAQAQLIGRDPSTDVAALRVADLGDISPALLGGVVRPGHLVLAVGRPAADGARVSFGAVSAVEGPRRSWHGGEIETIIFADVTLYPGFSGGALVDLAGRVVGMNSSRLTRAGSAALPVATLRRVAETLLTHGRVRRGYLGITTQQVALPEGMAQQAGLAQRAGLVVMMVQPGSPAERGGLLIGDVVVAVGGSVVSDAESLLASLGGETIGQQVPVRVLRGGVPQAVPITISERQ